MKKLYTILLFFLILFSLPTGLLAQNFYWEAPVQITAQGSDCRFADVVQAEKKTKNTFLFWQEIDNNKKQIYISMQKSTDGYTWKKKERFCGPFSYSGEVPQIYSASSNDKGRLAIAILSETREITVLFSDDEGETFTDFILQNEDFPLVAPRVYPLSNNEFIVFASLADKEKFNLVYSISKKGKKGVIEWSDFTEFEIKDKKVSNPFVPFIANVGFSGDLLVFQAQYSANNRLSFQIFSSLTKDNGKSWTEPVMLTGNSQTFTSYNNQRPIIYYLGSDVYMAWERSTYGSATSSIYSCTMNSKGQLKNEMAKINTSGNCYRPFFFSKGKDFCLGWTDLQNSMSQVLFSTKRKTFWDEEDTLISRTGSTAIPLICNKGKNISFAWQEKNAKGYSINTVVKDSSTSLPSIKAESFESGKRSAADLARATFIPSDDSSGIKGFSWIFTQDEKEEPPQKLMRIPQESLIEGNATKDGKWYFKVKQIDYADNWSQTAVLTYVKDTTPPLAPKILLPDQDDEGLLQSNTFFVNWQAAEDEPDADDIVGYSWDLDFIVPLERRLCESPRHPLRISKEELKEKILQLIEANEDLIQNAKEPPLYVKGDSIVETEQYKNLRNGIYVFSLTAIDSVGNISKASKAILALNKYIPSTYITAIDSKRDSFGDISLEIFGGGFTYDGNIHSIYIDKDGKAPYDYILTAEKNEFQIKSNNTIDNILLMEMLAGSYYIGLVHSDRGLYFSKDPLLEVLETGTVKIFNTYDFIPKWISNPTETKQSINISLLLLAGLLLLALLAIIVGSRALANVAKETITVNAEIRALLEGGLMPHEKKYKTEQLKKRGMGLRFKMMTYTTSLIVFLIILVILALSYIMMAREETTRSQGLYQRAEVLLDSMATGAKVNLPNAASNLLSLADLTSEAETLSDSRYAVITGYGANAADTNFDYIWATNDALIAAKIDTKTFVNGQSRFKVTGVEEITERCAKLNSLADEKVSFLSSQIQELNAEGLDLAGKNDAKSIERINEIGEITRQLNKRVSEALEEISKEGTGTYPSYDKTKINYEQTDYLFYKPVVYHYGNENTYVHGIVFLQINTQSLIDEMGRAKMAIIKMSIAALAISILLGLLTAILLSGIIVKPINRLARHVAMIRDTDDKKKLAGKEIKIKSKDEIGMLGDTVNEMTKGLVEAAVQAENLTFGKEVQTRFLPLQSDKLGNTLTTGSLKTKGADFFSYYAGADDLSGDYFDYKMIDPTHYAVIKCDVSGHGVPAALIMVEVATLFLNAFRSWNMKNPAQGTNISPVVGQINDLLESRGFKGRFAAFTMAIINTENGDCSFCNAGDNLIQIYDGKERRKKIITLPETPAAGMFPTDLVDMRGGYKVIKQKLKKGDILFLYTDGIEEAKRNFRDKSGTIIPCSEKGLNEGDVHGNHKVGETSEEMTPERVTEIIEKVYAGGTYVLKKQHDQEAETEYTFDFSNCEQTAEDAIMALVSVEKVFRMYKNAEPKVSDRVKVDRKIDEFLRLHFKEYGDWCSDRTDIENQPTHIYYHGILEDPQYDDLTLIAIKKN